MHEAHPPRGLYYHQSQELHTEMEMDQMPPGTEFVSHLGLKDPLEAVKYRFMSKKTGPYVFYILIAGFHAVGKSSLGTQIKQWVNHDEELADWAKKKGLPPIKVNTIPIASALRAGQEEGVIDPRKPQGSYDPPEYRAGSIIQSRFVGERSNNHQGDEIGTDEGPEIDIVEISGGPSMFRSLTTGKLIGRFDRGYTTGLKMAKELEEDTQAFIVDPGLELVEGNARTRQRIIDSPPEELPGILAEGNINIARGGKILKLEDLPPEELARIGKYLGANAAGPEGVLRGTEEAIRMGKLLTGGYDQEEVWHAWMETMGFDEFHYKILPNPKRSEPITMHMDLRREGDIIQDHIERQQVRRRGRKIIRYPHP